MSNTLQRMFERCTDKYGEICRAFYRGSGSAGVPFRAFVNDYRAYKRKRNGAELSEVSVAAGYLRPNSKIIYAPSEDFWKRDDLRILYRGKTYNIDFVSDVPVGKYPVYTWAVMNPVVSPAKDDYTEIGADEDD